MSTACKKSLFKVYTFFVNYASHLSCVGSEWVKVYHLYSNFVSYVSSSLFKLQLYFLVPCIHSLITLYACVFGKMLDSNCAYCTQENITWMGIMVNCGSTGQLLTQAIEQNSVTDDIDGTHTFLGYTNAINLWQKNRLWCAISLSLPLVALFYGTWCNIQWYTSMGHIHQGADDT